MTPSSDGRGGSRPVDTGSREPVRHPEFIFLILGLHVENSRGCIVPPDRTPRIAGVNRAQTGFAWRSIMMQKNFKIPTTSRVYTIYIGLHTEFSFRLNVGAKV